MMIWEKSHGICCMKWTRDSAKRRIRKLLLKCFPHLFADCQMEQVGSVKEFKEISYIKYYYMLWVSRLTNSAVALADTIPTSLGLQLRCRYKNEYFAGARAKYDGRVGKALLV